jgi:hypothetical protein
MPTLERKILIAAPAALVFGIMEQAELEDLASSWIAALEDSARRIMRRDGTGTGNEITLLDGTGGADTHIFLSELEGPATWVTCRVTYVGPDAAEADRLTAHRIDERLGLLRDAAEAAAGSQ